MIRDRRFRPQAFEEVPGARPRALPASFEVMLKPRGAVCNLECRYCFYLPKRRLYGEGESFFMSDAVLEAFTRQYIAAQRVPQASFAWQGGEPTLMGLEFFQRAVAFQRRHRQPGVRVQNSLQTNGIVLDDDWCRFLREEEFLVGLSLDGSRDLHDAYRLDRGGQSTFDRVHRALKLLQRHDVNVNVLCAVNRINGDYPLDVYRFFKREGVRFIQFLPVVGRRPDGGVAAWAVGDEQWGRFLCGVFDEWVCHDVGRTFVRHFDAALQCGLDQEPSLCVHARVCGNCLVMEHTGDVFSCDHFVAPDSYLGNVMETPITDLVASPFQRKFGLDKWQTLPRYCRECPVRPACNGGARRTASSQRPTGSRD